MTDYSTELNKHYFFFFLNFLGLFQYIHHTIFKKGKNILINL